MRNLKKIKQILILGKPFKVIFRKEKTGELVKDKKQNKFYLGTCNLDEQCIVLADHLALEETLDTILHEVFHVLEFYMRYDSSEAYVQRMSTILTAFLLDNFNITLKKGVL